MHTYIVTGIIQYCVYSQWSEIAISEEIAAMSADEAKRAVLARHTKITEQQDPYATVRWHSEELVQVRRVMALAWAA
jgi:hypothetical protein